MNRSGGALVTLALLAGAACTARPKPAPASVRLADLYILHAVEVRCRVSAGARLSLSFRGSEKVDLAEAVKRGREFPWRLAGPVVAGPEMRTYTLETRALPGAITASDTRHILLR